jgi:glutamine---fructose-6-phosphate transaminase (isomerizing)
MAKEYHFIQELREQPDAIRKSLSQTNTQLAEMARVYAKKIKRVILTGCGDPYMLSFAAVEAIEEWAGIPAEVVEAAEWTMYRNPALIGPETLVILITSSGKTVKVIDAARIAVARGATCFALTNRAPSPITNEVRQVVQTQSGWSDSFPTKQTTSALAVLYSFALHLAEVRETLPAAQIQSLRTELFDKVPMAMDATLKLEGRMEEIANGFASIPFYAYIGSGPNLATALLGAAKMKETNQSQAEGSNLEEYGHLHALSLHDGDPVFVVTEPGKIGERSLLIGQYIVANGGKPVVIGPHSESSAWGQIQAEYVEIPDHSEIYGPLIALLPLQMFAYYTALAKSRNPDRPPERGGMGYLQKIIYTGVLEGWEKR